jgi:hypothetical protein
MLLALNLKKAFDLRMKRKRRRMIFEDYEPKENEMS